MQRISDRWWAWGIHLLTASSALWGWLALEAAWRQAWVPSLWWMILALTVDSVDGSLARAARVRELIPEVDGSLLDNLVDYLNYVIVPAFFLGVAGLLETPFQQLLPPWLCLVSAFQFSHRDAKTAEGFFRGFPSYWNVVVLYLFLLRTPPLFNTLLLLFLSLACLAPLRFLYPSRIPVHRLVTVALGVGWALLLVICLALYPDAPPWLVRASLLYPLYYLGLSLYLQRKSMGKA